MLRRLWWSGRRNKLRVLQGHGSLWTGSDRHQVSITTTKGKITLVQRPHTQLYCEAWSLVPTSSDKPLVRSFFCEGEGPLAMTLYGKRIMSITINKAGVEVDNLPE